MKVLAHMLDWESLATTADAMVVSVGVATFDPYAELFNIDSTYYATIELIQPGRVLDPETLWFWMKQEKAQQEIFNPQYAQPLEEVVEQLHNYLTAADVEAFKVNEIWAKPADFDVSIARHLFSEHGLKEPWYYRNIRCLRMFESLYPTIKCKRPEGGSHNALEDAKFQALCAWTLMHAHRKVFNDSIYGGGKQQFASNFLCSKPDDEVNKHGL